MENKNFFTIKNIGLVFLATIILFFSISWITKTAIINNVAKSETLVVNAKDSCISTYDNGIKSILELAQVDEQTKDFLRKAISGSGEASEELNKNYEQLLNGNPAPFMVMMSTMSGTNFTITAENLQREITMRRNEMITCSAMMLSTQKLVKDAVGMDAGGNIVVFPNKHFFEKGDMPSSIVDASLRDNDGDGRLTVLDYKPPVNVDISNSFGSGEDAIGTLELYNK